MLDAHFFFRLQCSMARGARWRSGGTTPWIPRYGIDAGDPAVAYAEALSFTTMIVAGTAPDMVPPTLAAKDKAGDQLCTQYSGEMRTEVCSTS